MKNTRFLIIALILFVIGLLGMAVSVFGQTNDPAPPVPATGIDIPGLNLLPPWLQKYVLILVVLSPFLGRAWHSLRTGGGIRGIVNAIWFGTNTPTPPSDPPPASKLGAWLLIGSLAFGACGLTGCTIFGKTERTPQAQKFDTYQSVYNGAREAYKAFKRECFAGKVTAAKETAADKAWGEFRIAYATAFRIGMENTAAPQDIIALKNQLVRILLNL